MNYEDRDEISKVILSEDELMKEEKIFSKRKKRKNKDKKKVKRNERVVISIESE